MPIRQSDMTKTVTIHIKPITYQKLSLLAVKAETTKGELASEAIETYIRWLRKTDAEEFIGLTEEEAAVFTAHLEKVTRPQREYAVLRSLKARFPYLKLSHMKPRKPRKPNRSKEELQAAHNVPKTDKRGRPRKVTDNVPTTNNVPKTDNAFLTP